MQTDQLAYDFVLMPHRSLDRRGFVLVMALIGGISFLAGIVFILVGAWPVMGFLGLDVLLIWLALRLSFRSGRARERIMVTDDGTLKICRRAPSGADQIWEFQAYWARADMEFDERGERKLYIGSHDQRIRVGAFMPEDELMPLCHAVNDALRSAANRLARRGHPV